MNLRPIKSILLALGGIASSIALSSSAQTGAQAGAQAGTTPTTPGYSQLDLRPPSATADLNDSLTRLGENPRDISALIGAGEAALALDDPRAATGFFARADEIESGNGRIKAGLGRAMLQLQNPGEALRMFDQAERLGQPVAGLQMDRGLARDLTGDQAGAQRDYEAVLRATPDNAEAIRRYAVSLGISGQVDAAEKVIQPLLYKNDRAAWRNRAFVLAMNGRKDQARDITQRVMPKPLADAIQPYMERMAGLNPAQRAAAVHFGVFPSASGVRMAAATPVPVPVPVPLPSKPTPESSATVQAVPKPSAKPQPKPVPKAVESRALASILPAQQAVVPQPKPQAMPLPVKESPVQAAPIQATPVQIAEAKSTPPAMQGPIDPAPQTPVPVTAPAEATPAPSPAATRTLADIIRELDVPEAEKRPTVAAVDLSEIATLQEQKRRTAADKAKRDAVAKAKAEAAEKAKAVAAEKARLAANPSRNWVQIGTGQSVSALGFTLRALRKKHDSIAAKDAWTASWGRTNRLVVGPFASFAKAKDFEETMKKAGADVFAWQSEAGEEVTRMAGK